jgi:perosamine synthetase
MQIPAARILFTDNDKHEIAQRVTTALGTGALTLGATTREFETAFAAAHDAPYAVAVSSGTAALEIILRSLDVAGHDVIVPANTFAATAFAVLRAGANPVFADVDRATFAVSPATVETALTANTKAVVLVHIGGLIPPDVLALRQLCDERGITLVEDAAHAHGCSFAAQFAGSFGIAGAFSFYPTKVITSGEGGMIVTADERIRDEALIYRDQGKAGFLGNVHIREGYSWRMSELHAAVGLVHLRHLDEFLDVRQAAAARYDSALDAMDGFERLVVPPDGRSNYYKYIVLPTVDLDRAQFKKAVKERFGVSLTGEVYEAPLHRQPVFERFINRTLPIAEDVCARHMCLPVHSDMTDAEVDHVLLALREVGHDLMGNTCASG